MRHSISFKNVENMTKQSFKNECNINNIMAKFQKTGMINHYANNAPHYQDIPALDYHEALDIIATANSMFEELPSSVRAKFENSPEQFLEFVQNPDNIEKARELGLAPPLTITLSENEPDKPTKKRASAPPEPPEGSKPKDD